jgi:hypothetical protein
MNDGLQDGTVVGAKVGSKVGAFEFNSCRWRYTEM